MARGSKVVQTFLQQHAEVLARLAEGGAHLRVSSADAGSQASVVQAAALGPQAGGLGNRAQAHISLGNRAARREQTRPPTCSVVCPISRRAGGAGEQRCGLARCPEPRPTPQEM